MNPDSETNNFNFPIHPCHPWPWRGPVPIPPPSQNPFPSITTEPAALRFELEAEIARATMRENELAETASQAVIQSVQPVIEAANSAAMDAVEAAREARGVVAAEAVAAARSAVNELMSGFSRTGHSHPNATTSSNGFMTAADKTKLSNINVSGIVSQTISSLDSVYASKADVSGLERTKASVTYVNQYAARAACMTASPDGNSQIQVTNSGVPMLKVKTGNTLTRPYKTIVRYSTAPTVTYLGVGIQLPAELYFGWSSDYEATATGGYRVIAQVEDGDDSYQIRDLKIVYGENDDFSIVGEKVHVAVSDTFPYQPDVAARENFTLCTGSFDSTQSGFTVEHYDTETYPEVLTTYLVTEQSLGSLESRIAALEAAQS